MIRYAIIGCGRIAEKHAALCSSTGKLNAVCDINKEKALTLAQRYDAKAYYKIENLLDNEPETDVIVICTPNGLHALHSILSLRAGFHVLCEKPMAIFATDCEKMIAEAARAQKQLFIVKQNRFNPAVVAVKQLLDENKLGKVFSVQLNCFWNRGNDYYSGSWKGTKEMDGGILYTQFSHFIDLLYWMTGEMETVTTYTRRFMHENLIEFEDTGVAGFVMKSGVIGSLHFTINSYKENMEGSFTIFAEQATVKIGGRYLNEIAYQNIKEYTIPAITENAVVNDYGSYQGSMSNHDKMYRHVAEVLEGSTVNRFTGTDGLKTVEIIEKIYKAAV